MLSPVLNAQELKIGVNQHHPRHGSVFDVIGQADLNSVHVVGKVDQA